MSIALVVYYLIKRSVEASPIPVSGIAQSFQPSLPPSSSCDDLHSCRTIWNIIWSCLATIFSCVWVAFHPNVPDPSKSRLATKIERVKFAILALLAPEIIIYRAVTEDLAASDLARRYKDRGWTKTHGFFVEMGGFVSYRGDKLRALSSGDFRSLIDSGKINIPRITKEEIMDKSKGDMLSKWLVVFQTGWFIFQCSARAVKHLPITELEIATLAFASVNLMTYLIWWNKPLNVHCPVRVPMSEHRGRESSRQLRRFQVHPVRYPKKQGTGSLGKRYNDIIIRSVLFLVATLFGAIHCVAWFFHFPSEVEQLLWRVSSAAATCLPLFILFMVWMKWTEGWPDNLIFSVIMGLYILARIALLVIPFTSLRSLPPGAYQIIQWTNYIPHI